MNTIPIEGRYYDGLSARTKNVLLIVSAPHLQVWLNDGQQELLRQIQLKDLSVSERLMHAPRVIQLPDDARVEVSDHTSFDQVLSSLGIKEPEVVKWQYKWRYAICSALLISVLLVVSYVFLVPVTAYYLAEHIKPHWAIRLTEQVHEIIDKQMTEPSQISALRQAKIVDGFSKLGVDAPTNHPIPIKIEFRKSKVGPNAFALPDGTIIVTDQLINLSNSDEEVLAVLAHEAGHIYHKHGLKQAIQSALVGTILGGLMGDASAALSGLAINLVQLSYSREFELEADDFAVNTLRKNHLSPTLLATVLRKLESEQKKSPEEKEHGVSSYFSTHPNTEERTQRLLQASQ